MRHIFFLPRLIAVYLITLYQKTLSFDHGMLKLFYPNGYCRYYPSCSQYAIEAITKHGFIKGGLMSFWRILRCNPWSKGGIDNVK